MRPSRSFGVRPCALSDLPDCLNEERCTMIERPFVADLDETGGADVHGLGAADARAYFRGAFAPACADAGGKNGDFAA